MKASTVAFALAVAFAAGGFGTAWAQDALQIIEKRQSVMKQQGKDVGAVKALLDGKGDQAAALAGADDLLKTIPAIPTVFPQKTSSADYPGKTRAKPAIWAEWDKFTAAQQNALAKAQALDAAIRSGNKVTIQTAFEDMGKSGCGGCHTPFREPAQQ
jgi:cytochrome c556